MYKVTRTQTRPNINVAFYLPQWIMTSDEEIEYCTHFAREYAETAAWIVSQYEYSDDGLTLNLYNFWSSKEDYLKFKLDPLGLARFNFLMDKYCLENNLTHRLVEEKTISPTQ